MPYKFGLRRKVKHNTNSADNVTKVNNNQWYCVFHLKYKTYLIVELQNIKFNNLGLLLMQ